MRLSRAALLVPALALAAGCGSAASTATATAASAAADGVTVVVHRTETCGCCGGYEDELEAAGFTVEQVMHDDIMAVKDDFGVPDDERSCHTNEVDGYAVEGHVPVQALLDLLAQAPDVAGISLAGMPAGSPGMPGEQTEPFVVRTFADGVVTGELGRY